MSYIERKDRRIKKMWDSLLLFFEKGGVIMKSDSVKTGIQQAPHRSLFNALGMTEEELAKPLVGIVCSYESG